MINDKTEEWCRKMVARMRANGGSEFPPADHPWLHVYIMIREGKI